MKAQRPYLLRALYEWLIDSDEVPYVLVDATADGVQVPSEHVEDGQIVLNIGPNAVRDLIMEDDYVMCSSRFGGRTFELILPMGALRAIYGRDSALGMVFPDDPGVPKAADTQAAPAENATTSDAIEPAPAPDSVRAPDKPVPDKPAPSTPARGKGADGKPTLKLV